MFALGAILITGGAHCSDNERKGTIMCGMCDMLTSDTTSDGTDIYEIRLLIDELIISTAKGTGLDVPILLIGVAGMALEGRVGSELAIRAMANYIANRTPDEIRDMIQDAMLG
jgi:hypothetical protein